MRYYALACDYDGTIATEGKVDSATLDALEQLRSSGRKLILVSGRELEDLERVFPHFDLFDRLVLENGALLYRPETREEKVLAEPPPPQFVERLRERGVAQVSVGRSIVATWEPHQVTVLETIKELGLELQVIFNKGAVMVLPSGINKASGLAVALKELSLSAHNTVGVGDAENDHAFLSLCECSVAVANALPMVKERADWVTPDVRGAGVRELIEQIITSDLKNLESKLQRHDLLLGHKLDGAEIHAKPYGTSIMLAGTSGGGKSTFSTSFLERLKEHNYQFCIIDPEGDYQSFEDAVAFGDPTKAPLVHEVTDLLEKSEESASVNLLGIKLEDRPVFFGELFSALLKLRAATGRPHWIVIDETHHLLPSGWAPAPSAIPHELHGLMLITVHPDSVSDAVLSAVDLMVAIGKTPTETINSFCGALSEPLPVVPEVKLNPGEGIGWWRKSQIPPFHFRGVPPHSQHLRHVRKYAQGELPPDRSFYFRGPDGKLNLRAQNLMLFMQLADGVDDDTWMHHLRHGEYSQWMREAIKDNNLAQEVENIEKTELSADASRAAIKAKIEQRYTAPA